ncbi:Sterol O-acyltransferase 1 [Araneus ventricosus]|uniref:Sterol O-acyltransferase 1 n=1 Tax=Araneus ventricosus TaxID=182803 RepID=A0A4Y2MCH0_ARAVE|nr:Sterol O-acyltransferase 1 [Araneus ventricosus]
MFVGTLRVLLQNVLKPIIHVSIMCEQVRIFMKFYSFVRESAPRVLQYKPSKDGKQEHNLYPTITHYTFFLFAPVLIYRDSYPRRKEVNYKFALAQLFKFFACLFIGYSGTLRFLVDVFRTTGITPFTLKELSLMYAGSMVIGALSMFVIFYAILHSWLNFFAEILRFADREFYQDWWNSTSFSHYYRKCNTVVHDWLYTYIYVETINAGLSRSAALMAVFFVSSLVHEYIIALSLGFFYPIMAVMNLTVGVPLTILTHKKTGQFWNTFMWSMLFSGWGLIIIFYTFEWHARSNCKGLEDPVLDFCIPRSWSASCNVIAFS